MLKACWLWLIIFLKYVGLTRLNIESHDPIFFTGTGESLWVSRNYWLAPCGPEFGAGPEIPADHRVQTRPRLDSHARWQGISPDGLLRLMPWSFCIPTVLADGQITDGKICQTVQSNVRVRLVRVPSEYGSKLIHQDLAFNCMVKMQLAVILQGKYSEVILLLWSDIRPEGFTVALVHTCWKESIDVCPLGLHQWLLSVLLGFFILPHVPWLLACLTCPVVESLLSSAFCFQLWWQRWEFGPGADICRRYMFIEHWLQVFLNSLQWQGSDG